MGRRAGHLVVDGCVLLVVTLAVLDYTARSSWTSPAVLALSMAWLVTVTVVIVADRCLAAGRAAAGWSLTLALATVWGPFLAGRSWVWPLLDGALLAMPALVPACLAAHATAWSSHSPGPRVALVKVLTVVAAATTALVYAPVGDPLCTRGCGSVAAPWADPADAPTVVVAVAVLTGTAAILGLLILGRERSRLPLPVVLGVTAGLTMVMVLVWFRGTAWGLTPGPPPRALWHVLPVGLAAAGSGRHLWVLRSTSRRLRAVATGLERLDQEPPGGPVHFALPAGRGWVDRDGCAVEFEPAPDRVLILRDVDGLPWVRLISASGQRHPPAEPSWDAGDVLHLENARQTALLRADQRDVEHSRRGIVARSDAERRRVERDLHDGVQQRLVSAKLQLAIARSVAPPELAAVLREAEERTQRALAVLREVSHGLFPRSLVDDGLPTALHELAGQRPLDLTFTGPVTALPLGARTTVYAVIRRLLEHAATATADVPRPVVRVDVTVAQVRLRMTIAGLRRDGAAMMLVEVEDRVGAVGGSVTATNADGSLDVMVVLPCAS